MGTMGTVHASGVTMFGGGATGVISPASMYSIGRGVANIAPGTNAWSAANRALYVPFRVTEEVTVYQIGFGSGATAGGNVSVGIYDSAYNRLVSGTAARVVSSETFVNTTDVVLLPGLYYMGMAVDGTNNMATFSLVNVQIAHLIGIRMEESAYPLPDPMTPVKTATVFAPFMGLWLRSE
jgi:hypothetical protein